MHILSRTSIISIMVWIILLPVLLCGCGDDPNEKKTVKGLQEENRVLQDKIEYLLSREQELRRDHSNQLSEKESTKLDVQLRLPQLHKENGELKAAHDLDERIVTHTGNVLWWSLIISCNLNIGFIGWVLFFYYDRWRAWIEVNQYLTAKVGDCLTRGGVYGKK